jgi:hypothetical protein
MSLELIVIAGPDKAGSCPSPQARFLGAYCCGGGILLLDVCVGAVLSSFRLACSHSSN